MATKTLDTRERMVKDEAQRRTAVAEQRAALEAELAAIAAPVIEFRRLERRIAEIENHLQGLRNSDSALHAQFQRDLEAAIPAEVGRMLNAARAELNRRHANPSAELLARLAAVRDWTDAVAAARRDPAKLDGDMLALTEAGRALRLTGNTPVFTDPAWMTARTARKEASHA